MERIAIVGTGISGLTAAWLLSQRHDVTVLEASDRIGGHTHTVDVEVDGERHAVDTGFIVFNETTYPNFCRILDRLGIESQPTDMSFSVRCDRSGVEYATHSWSGLFARSRSIVSPRFHRLLLDVRRFGRLGRELATSSQAETESLGSWLAKQRFSDAFVEHYVVPMGAAIWSADPGRFLEFPAAAFARFFANHGLLDPRDNIRWRVIRGGSRTYVGAMTRSFRDRIRTRSPVLGVRRDSGGVRLLLPDGVNLRFDHVVFACHSDEALGLLQDASSREHELLGAIGYQPNEVTLHTDASVMPSRRAAWASWNYRIPDRAARAASVTYDMGRLQGLQASRPLLVSLNSDGDIDPACVLGRFRYSHPVYDAAALEAQRRRSEIDGTARTHFCGAYWGNGFHEDGVASALAVAARFGTEL